MTRAETDSSASSGLQARFYTTHWSVVLAVAQSDGRRAQEALAKLCRTYWYPLYAYVRRRGYSAPDAQDLTQDFFTKLLERSSLARATPELGKFRSYLLTAMKHFQRMEAKSGVKARWRGSRDTFLLTIARSRLPRLRAAFASKAYLLLRRDSCQ